MAAIPALVNAIANKYNSTLNGSINASDLTITVSSGSGLNANGGYVIIDKGLATEEVVYIESVSGTTLTVATNGRGVEGTSAASHSSGASIQDVLVKNHINALNTKVTTNTSDIAGLAATVIGTIYPIGSLYTSTLSTNPGTLLGLGTWVAFGAGRVMVGIDAGQTEFDTVEETGGAKTHTLQTTEMPSHTHTENAHAHTNAYSASSANVDLSGFGGWTTLGVGTESSGNTAATLQNTGGGGAHNNLQPYIVVYMWKRTA